MAARSLCVQELRYLCKNLELPYCYNTQDVQLYLLSRTRCIICTVCSSLRLYDIIPIIPLELLIIDEAAQLKECETLIPLQLPGIKHAVFIGDEYQLPALVKSRVSSLDAEFFFSISFFGLTFNMVMQKSDSANFGRSVFERLSSLGYSKHLLNIQ